MADARVSSVSDDLTESLEFRRNVQAGNSSAFVTLFEFYYPRLVRFLNRYVFRDIAEDLAQDTLVRVWERCGDIDPQRSLRAYIFTAARNRTLMYLEHEGVVADHVQYVLPRMIDQHAPPADADLLAWEAAQLAEQKLAELPSRQREIWGLSRNEGLSPVEIAEVLGITVSTVYVQLARTVKALYPVLHDWLDEPD